MPQRKLPRLMLYFTLIVGAGIFSFPLVWMLSTALKPVEQTMTFPPTWIPMSYHAEIDGRMIEVTRGQTVETQSALIEITSGERAGQRLLLPADATLEAGMKVLKKLPQGWIMVTERMKTRQVTRIPKLDALPPERITATIQPRWENFPVALATMGGRTIEELEGHVESVSTGPDGDVGFGRYLLNTLTVCVLGVAGAVISNSIIAYGFARLRWPGRDALFAITLATMMVPGPVLMVPLYGVFKSFGWIGTLTPLWAPAWFGAAFNIFLMRQFFRSIPEELSEAARIDGCSEWHIFVRIILPLSMPVVAVVALFHFLYAWNDFMGPLLYLTRKQTFTLALALQEYQSQHTGVQWQHLMAASAVTVLPIIILFFLAQKTFIQGIATTGGKS